MGEGSYLNFDLIVERVGEKYRARIFDSPAGQASTEFDIPFSELELENFVLRMGRPRSGVRRVESSEMEAVKGCGERLFRAVFKDDVYAAFLRSRDCALEEGTGLRVRLRIDVPEFHDYPWEYLYNAHLNQFLALSRETPVVRYLELPYPVHPLTVQPPLKILVMISSPQGFPQLQVEEEWKRLSKTLAPLVHRGLVMLERLKKPTLSVLQQHLRRGEYHIFHFIGHGKYSEHKQDGMLLLEDESGQGRAVSGQYLGTVLHDHRSLRLVVLNACEGARTSQEDPYAGVAQTLVLQGIPAVIAMQFEILETAAITFAQEFYGAVADGFPVDAAVSEARKAIFATGNDVEWGTPVLYMRTPQGVIFEIPEAQRVRHALSDEPISYVDKELEQKLEQLYTEGLAAFWVEDWDRACDRFQRILTDRPDHAAAADKLAESKRQRQLSILHARAVEAQKAENWALALQTLEELQKESPDYKDTAATLRIIKKQKQLADLYAEAKKLHAAQKWQAVAKVFDQIRSIDSMYPDPENLLPTAETELAELKRLAELKELYSRAVRAMDAGQWEEAQTLLRQVQEKESGFLETERLLSIAEAKTRQTEAEKKRQDQVNTLYEQAHGLLRSKKWRKALDKIEEIRELDEQFDDPEKIAEQAQKELVREEQEAERQNELAAMYAEAVRLLREEKYQEALEKWQEIKGIDPKYPDRQRVQGTAKKSLAAFTKPAIKKRRINLQQSFWIGLGGIVIVGVIILALNFSGNLGEVPSSPATSAPIPLSGGKVAAPTTTKIPVMTNTPKVPTGIQTTGEYTDPTLYDGFDDNAYENSYNKSLWRIDGNFSKHSIYQKDGQLIFEVSDAKNVGFYVPTKETINKPTFFEMRALLDTTTTDTAAHLYMNIIKDEDHTNCGVFDNGDKTQSITCWSQYYGKKVEANLELDGIAPGWHIYRFEIEPETMTISYIIDGEPVGKFVPENVIPERVADLKKVPFYFWIGLNNFGPSEAPVGYIDYVRMGAIEDSTLYDNFDDSKYDGSYNHVLWDLTTYRVDSKLAADSVKQVDGKMILLVSGNDTILGLMNNTRFSFANPYFCETQIRLDENSSEGWASLTVGFYNEIGYFGQINCSLSYDNSGNQVFGCHTGKHVGNSYMDIFNTISLKVDPTEWHTVRIEMYPDDLTFKLYINGKLFFSKSNIEDFANAKFSCGFQVSDEFKTDPTVIGYFDNFRMGAIENDSD